MFHQAYMIAGLIFLLGISMSLIHFIASLMKKGFGGSEPDESYPNTESGQKYYQANNQWRLALERVGVKVEMTDLAKISDSHLTNNKDYVPFEVLFEREDVHYLLSCFYPRSRWGEDNDGYNVYGIKTDSLESALYVKGLLDYVKTIQEAKGLIGNPDTRERWSSEANEKWEMLEKEESEAKETIKSIIYEKPLNNNSFLLSFSNDAILTDEERLQLVDEKIMGAKPVVMKRRPELDTSLNTSPALVALNTYLNENELPEDIYGELKDTMTKIEDKLRNEKKERQEDEIRMEAKAENETAKKYHGIS